MTPAQALSRILDEIRPTETVNVPFLTAQGRVLHEGIFADRAMPPFDRVMMDGIALRSEALQKGRTFTLIGEAAAGRPQLQLKDSAAAIRVNTGAVLPAGCDQVIPIEELSIDGTHVTVADSVTPEPGVFIHAAGSDFGDGSQLIDAGVRVGSKEMGVITSVGKEIVAVAALPTVAVISTGDELVSVAETPEPYQIRRSNAHALQAACAQLGIAATAYHLADDRDSIATQLPDILRDHDWIILSGGISKGSFDYVPETLQELGARQHLQWIKQRPGKPMAFFTLPDQTPIFALPGNPMSTLVCFHRYVIPALNKAYGLQSKPPQTVALYEGFQFKKPLAYFLPVSLRSSEEAVSEAIPIATANSGDFASVMRTDGFIELPAEQDLFPAGSTYRFTPWV